MRIRRSNTVRLIAGCGQNSVLDTLAVFLLHVRVDFALLLKNQVLAGRPSVCKIKLKLKLASDQIASFMLKSPGLPLDLEAPVMTPNGVIFLLFFLFFLLKSQASTCTFVYCVCSTSKLSVSSSSFGHVSVKSSRLCNCLHQLFSSKQHRNALCQLSSIRPHIYARAGLVEL